MKDVGDDDVDRRQVQGVRALEPSRTNDLKVVGYERFESACRGL